jgi:hypothetical protein
MRNFLGLLGTAFGRNEARPESGLSESPNHVVLFEAQMFSVFDMDSIWYYERLKWQTRD